MNSWSYDSGLLFSFFEISTRADLISQKESKESYFID